MKLNTLGRVREKFSCQYRQSTHGYYSDLLQALQIESLTARVLNTRFLRSQNTTVGVQYGMP